MYPGCAYDPGLLLFTMSESRTEPDPRHDALAVAVTLAASAILLALLALVP